jgi:hypothetical protein
MNGRSPRRRFRRFLRRQRPGLSEQLVRVLNGAFGEAGEVARCSRTEIQDMVRRKERRARTRTATTSASTPPSTPPNALNAGLCELDTNHDMKAERWRWRWKIRRRWRDCRRKKRRSRSEETMRRTLGKGGSWEGSTLDLSSGARSDDAMQRETLRVGHG